MNKSSLIFIVLFFPFFSYAEKSQISCYLPVEKDSILLNILKDYEKSGRTEPNSYQKCLDSDFIKKKIFTFDTNNLQKLKAKAKITNESCSKEFLDEDVEANMYISPEFIDFRWSMQRIGKRWDFCNNKYKEQYMKFDECLKDTEFKYLDYYLFKFARNEYKGGWNFGLEKNLEIHSYDYKCIVDK